MAEEKSLEVPIVHSRDKTIYIEQGPVSIYTGEGGIQLREALHILQRVREAQKAQSKDISDIKIALQVLADEPAIREQIAKIKAAVQTSDETILDEMRPDHNPPLSTDKK